ncbi:MAG: ubiquinone biosynthesis protein Coq4 [Candidatus Azotimanducaceae bacterium]|jgi:ubiquinone biosynthesis protein Coq4
MSETVKGLEQRAIRPDPLVFQQTLALAKAGGRNAQLEIAGSLLWCAFAAPQAISPIYDVLSQTYLDLPIAAASLEVPEAAIPNAFWQVFEETLTGPEGGYDASTITATVAALGSAVAPEFHALVEEAARQHSGADNAATKPVPPLMSFSDIESCPSGSLGNALYRMLVDNGYDPEVLDRDAIGLSNLKPAVRYLNTRILQMHDVWHLVAGYETTSLHEIAISSFQLAQFGHNYSAMFLATVATMSRSNGPDAFNLMMRIIAESWVHGREVPPLMAIEFETEWQASIEDIRQRHHIEPFKGSFPADLFEQLKAAGAAA